MARWRRLGGPAMCITVGAVAVLLRLPFLTSGLGEDEGGYAYVARAWGHGAHLYNAAWVDRPQGLLLAYRALLAIADKPWAVRLGALLAGLGITLLVGAIAWLLVSFRAGAAAALIYAIVAVGPHVQGFTFNGELAAALPATASVASAVAWQRRGGSPLLICAGVCGGVAILMKQSGFDGLLAAVLVAGATSASARQRLGRVSLVLGGAAVPIAASAIDGLALGWNSYWQAVVGWRASEDLGARLAARPGLLLSSLGPAVLDLGLLAGLAVAGVVIAARARGVLLVAPLWLFAAFAGFNTGGLYWPHYYIQLIPPLALLGGIAAAAPKSRRLAFAATAAVVAPVVATLTYWAAASSARVPFHETARRDGKIAVFIAQHSGPRDTIYALDSQGDLYYLADRRSADPYIWGHPLLEIPGALAGLRRVLGGPARPKLVILYKDPASVDRRGTLMTILTRDYRLVWRVSPRGTRVLERRP